MLFNNIIFNPNLGRRTPFTYTAGDCCAFSDACTLELEVPQRVIPPSPALQIEVPAFKARFALMYCLNI